MAGSSMTITRMRLGDVIVYKFVWVSDDTTGNVSGATAEEVVGYVLNVVTVPNTGGTTPSSYGLTMKNPDGLDHLNGLGVTRSTTATEMLTPSKDGIFPVMVASALTLAITGAGNSKGGTTYLHLIQLGSSAL